MSYLHQQITQNITVTGSYPLSLKTAECAWYLPPCEQYRTKSNWETPG